MEQEDTSFIISVEDHFEEDAMDFESNDSPSATPSTIRVSPTPAEDRSTPCPSNSSGTSSEMRYNRLDRGQTPETYNYSKDTDQMDSFKGKYQNPSYYQGKRQTPYDYTSEKLHDSWITPNRSNYSSLLYWCRGFVFFGVPILNCIGSTRVPM